MVRTNPSPPTDAGSYLASVTAETDDYIGALDIAFTIDKKAVTVGLPADKTITAGGKVSFTVDFTGMIKGESLIFGEGYKPSITTPPNTNTAGTYTITWTNADEATVTAGADTKLDNYAVTKRTSCKLIITAKTGGGGGGGGGSSTVTVPVTGKDSVNVSASVSGSTATISKIDTSKVGADSSMVTIDLTGLNKSINKVILPTKTVDAIDKANAEGLELKLSTGVVEFDAMALSAITDAANGSTISLEVKETSASTLSGSQRETIDDLDNAVVVNINMVSNGKVISDFKGGKATVTIPYELKAGQDPDSVTVYFLASDGTLTAMQTSYDARTGTVTFIAPHFSSYVITSEAGGWVNPFVDVKSGDWFYEAVKSMNKKGLMAGTSEDTFSPNGTTTRGMIVTILYRLEGIPAVSGGSGFSDVTAGQYYSDAIIWASANGVVTGYSDGRFGPNDLITREQMAAILYRYASFKGYDVSTTADLSSFTDASSISAYAATAMQWANGKGLITGVTNNTLAPTGTATRAQVATILMRFCENLMK